MPTNSKEDYLKAILMLEGRGPHIVSDVEQTPVSTTALADRLDMRPASVTGMLRNLSESGWIHYEAYRGARLTGTGRKIALDIVRRHRLWEVFLVDKLGFGWDEVHDLAEQLEHIEHPELMNRLAAFLGDPAYDPHGDPIPGATGEIHDPRKVVRLSECMPGESCEVKGVVDSSDGFLQHLNEFEIGLGLQFVVGKVFEYDGSIEIDLGDRTVIWTRSVAENLYVEPQLQNRYA